MNEIHISDKTKNTILKMDKKLNEKFDYEKNDLAGYLHDLINFKRVEVGWRQSCGSTDRTQVTYRAWVKVIDLLTKEGISINQERVKHGNAYATTKGGFWSSIIYSMPD